MATTTVSFVPAEGGTADITFGTSVGDSTRNVEIFARPNTGYEFVGWEITIEDSGTGGGGGGVGDNIDFSI